MIFVCWISCHCRFNSSVVLTWRRRRRWNYRRKKETPLSQSNLAPIQQKRKLQNVTSEPQRLAPSSWYSRYVPTVQSTCDSTAAFSSPTSHFGSCRACTRWWPAARSWIVPCSPYTAWQHRSATSNAPWTPWRPSASKTRKPLRDGRAPGFQKNKNKNKDPTSCTWPVVAVCT